MSWKSVYELPKSVTKEDLAYTAGLLDGEGCITITKQKPGNGGRVNVSHRLYVKVTLGQREVLAGLQRLFKIGAISVQRHKRFNDGYNWWVAALQAAALLRVLRPYLKVKARQADLALKFADTYWQRGGSRLLPANIIARRERLYIQLQEAKPSHRFRV